MAGIYLHVPFCKQACYYCDFHFSTNQKYVREMVEALCTELKLQKDYLQQDPISTIYFGGGTPSLLTGEQLKKLLDIIKANYVIAPSPEITLEANPDDLTAEKLEILYQTGVNRLSIGIQSFNPAVLNYLNRAHSQQQALKCFEDARKSGFDNISIDLIYAIPADNHENWHRDLDQALALQPEHISSYSLTIEPRTTFGTWLLKGNIPPIDEEFSAAQFEILLERLSHSGYEQYEVSNFCRPGYHSRHNSGYWKQEKYLGIGPSAHSYDGVNRRFNISHNPKYLKAIAHSEIPYEADILTNEDRINEYLLTTLRTKWGANLEKLKNEWSYDLLADQREYLDRLLTKSYAIIDGKHLKLTRSGLLLADKISSDLFKI
ncbi:radical SAM family heme chaperone HemW [Fulvivirga ulvae]|uniref:radical SAM family heme chaperone HemW n=1 Tax=Fulvivirga ulvae TaxID=2904245 RepID=UPI001F1E2ECC|nr:radical SAM family heme chaperone HemW [Fulvivirga ulvae]UII34221.1 radical SAM family heme chaperone HemW [Fulvivirga ulvae]